MLVDFANYEISGEIIFLLTKCHDHNLVFAAPKHDFVELRYAAEVYFKEHLEWALTQFLSMYPPKHGDQFWFKYFSEEPIQLKISEEIEEFSLPGYHLQTPPTILNFLKQFYLCIQKNPHVKVSPNHAVSEVNDYLFEIVVIILHRLKYLNLHQQSIFIPAAALVKASPQELEEELILLFELIRHNLLLENLVVEKYPIFMSFEKFTQNNKFDEILYSDSLCQLLKSNFERKAVTNIHSKSNSDLIGSSFDRQNQSESKSYSIFQERPEILKLGLMKSLTIFYRAIKEFQYDYLDFYQLDTASLKADFVLSRAFDEVLLHGLLICSRVFCFLVTDYSITDFYAYDFYNFLPLVLTVQKSIRLIVDACKVRFYQGKLLEPGSNLHDRLEAKLPFRKNYSVDAGKLIKLILTKFIIFETLIRDRDPFAKILREQLSPAYLRAHFHIPFDMSAFLKKGKALIQALSVFLTTIQHMSESKIYNNILEPLPYINSILQRMINFYESLHG